LGAAHTAPHEALRLFTTMTVIGSASICTAYNLITERPAPRTRRDVRWESPRNREALCQFVPGGVVGSDEVSRSDGVWRVHSHYRCHARLQALRLDCRNRAHDIIESSTQEEHRIAKREQVERGRRSAHGPTSRAFSPEAEWQRMLPCVSALSRRPDRAANLLLAPSAVHLALRHRCALAMGRRSSEIGKLSLRTKSIRGSLVQ
jgi:hypothetical protein